MNKTVKYYDLLPGEIYKFCPRKKLHSNGKNKFFGVKAYVKGENGSLFIDNETIFMFLTLNKQDFLNFLIGKRIIFFKAYYSDEFLLIN